MRIRPPDQDSEVKPNIKFDATETPREGFPRPFQLVLHPFYPVPFR